VSAEANARPDHADERAGAAGWKALLAGAPDPVGADREALAAWAGRMADLVSPALADHLFEPWQERWGPLLDPERAAKARLYSAFLWRRQVEAVRLLRDSGVRFVCLKGFALAHQIYARPDARIVGDVDLLLDPTDLGKAVAALSGAGFAAMPIPSRFGFISDSSYLPIVSPDRQVALDLHVAPDAWPAGRALTVEAVFARAAPFQAGELTLLGPAAEHSFFLLVTNIAKDRFGPEGVRKVVDAAMLLRARVDLDWELVEALARSAGYAGALAAFLRLIDRLGGGIAAPQRLLGRIGVRAERELARVASLYLKAQVPRLGFFDKLRREFLLGPDPVSVARINLKRLMGLAHPRTGLPPGLAERR
jgi:hypothetical protein